MIEACAITCFILQSQKLESRQDDVDVGGAEGGLEVVMKYRDLGGEGQGVFTRSTKKSGEQKAIAYSNGCEIGRQRYHLQKQCSSTRSLTPLRTASISASRSVVKSDFAQLVPPPLTSSVPATPS